jgi:uncharacterized membrane protein YfcA
MDINQIEPLFYLLSYLLTGAFAGFFAGLLGIGGGLIIVPVLYFIFSSQGYDQQHVMHMALATSLATIIITSISSTYAHNKKHAVLWKVVLLLAPGICLGAWFGAIFATYINTPFLKSFFGVFELFVAALMFNSARNQQNNETNTIQQKNIIKPARAFFGGNFIGFLSAIVGIGGGTLTVPFLNWHNINIKNAVASSAACGFPIAAIGTLSYIVSGWSLNLVPQIVNSELNNILPTLTFGYLQLNAFLLIALSSFIFAPLGARASHKLSDISLKKVFSVFLFFLGLRMLL